MQKYLPSFSVATFLYVGEKSKGRFPYKGGVALSLSFFFHPRDVILFERFLSSPSVLPRKLEFKDFGLSVPFFLFLFYELSRVEIGVPFY